MSAIKADISEVDLLDLVAIHLKIDAKDWPGSGFGGID